MKEWMFIITLAYGNDCSVHYSTLFYTLRNTLFYAVIQAQVHTAVCCSTLFSSTLFHAVCYCSIPVPRCLLLFYSRSTLLATVLFPFHAVCYCSIPVPRCLLLFYSVPRCSIGPPTVPHCSALFYIVTHFSTQFDTLLQCPHYFTLSFI